MHIYAIGDLHLSGEPASKPMEVFGEHWTGHKEKIKENYCYLYYKQNNLENLVRLHLRQEMNKLERKLLF